MVRWDISEKWKIKLEQTLMNYLAQQPGGLVDFQFEENPRQSLRERDLVDGIYQNFGHESRPIHRYKTGGRFSTLLTGFRMYRGYSQSKQGLADAGKEATFHFLNPDDLETAAYEFPSWNTALFTENLFNISER